MPELALDDDQRDAFVSHLDCVSIAELVWREPARTPAAAAVRRNSARAAALDQWLLRRTVDDAQQRTDRQLEPRLQLLEAHASMPTSRRRPPLPRRTRSEPRR